MKGQYTKNDISPGGPRQRLGRAKFLDPKKKPYQHILSDNNMANKADMLDEGSGYNMNYLGINGNYDKKERKEFILTLKQAVQDSINTHDYENANIISEHLVQLTGDAEDIYTHALTLYYLRIPLYALDKLLDALKRSPKRKYQILAIRCYLDLNDLDGAQNLINMYNDMDDVSNSKEMSVLNYLEGLIAYKQGNIAGSTDSLKKSLYNNHLQFNAFNLLMSREIISSSDEGEFVKNLLMGCPSKLYQYVRNFYNANILRSSTWKSALESLDLLSTVYKLDNSPNIQLAYATTYYLAYVYEKAFELLNNLITTEPNYMDAYPLYISICYETGKLKELYVITHYLMDKFSKSAVAWYSTAIYCTMRKKFEEARRFFFKAHELSPQCYLAWLGLGHSFSMTGEHDQAILIYTTCSKLLPCSPYPQIYIAMESNVLKNDKIYEEHVILASKFAPYDPIVLNECGVLAYKKGKYTDALKFFSEALKQSSTNELSKYNTICSIYCNFGRVCIKLKEYSDALKYYKFAYLKNSTNYRIIGWLGLAYQLNRRYSKAIDCYSQALRLCPSDPFAYEMRNMCLKYTAFLPLQDI